MWIASRGCFYCDRCDAFIQVDRRQSPPPYLSGSWFHHLPASKSSTLHGTFMLCRQCGIFLSQEISNRVTSTVPPEFGCDACGKKLSLAEEVPDQFLRISWVFGPPQMPVAQGKSSINLCPDDAKSFLDEIDAQLKYPSRR